MSDYDQPFSRPANDEDDLWEEDTTTGSYEAAAAYAPEANEPAAQAPADDAEEVSVDALRAYEKDELDHKIVQNFPGKIVRKDLSSMLKRGANVPTFVLEYLLGMYCSGDDTDAIEQGVERIRNILANNYVRPDESERIKSKIRELGQYTIIDKLSAKLDEYKDIYVASFANLNIEPFVIPADYVRNYSKILQGGIWCIMRMEYLTPEDEEDIVDDLFDEKPRIKPKKRGKRGPEDSPFKVASLTPIQMPNLDLDSLIAHRTNFTRDEWLALMLRSAGYEPSAMSERERMHFLERMVPLVERNYNLCELGPRGTGKSHIYKEVSPYAILLSGGQTTTANLFGRMNSHSADRIGLVGYWDCVTFDEVAGMRFKDTNAVQIMKDYMASGSYARGRDSINADASMVFEGNINDTVANVLKTTHLFDPFPPEFNNDSAFFDRIHHYLPGWEVPKMRSDLLTGRYGLITDCLSEFCKEMRKQDFSQLFDRYFRLNADFNKRDEIAVRKTFSGLAKLMFPDERMDKEDVRWLLEYAIEGRRRVKEQLKIMAGIEFIDTGLGYLDVDNPQDIRVIDVPEQSDGTLIPDGSLLPGHVFGVGRAQDGDYAVWRLENKVVDGDCKLKTEGIGNNKSVRETIEAAFEYFRGNAARVAPGMHVERRDYLMFFNDLQGKGLSEEVSLAEFIGLCSAACNRPVSAGLVIPGVLRLSGTMDAIRGLEDIVRVSKNAGAKKILLPYGCIQDLTKVSQELLGGISTSFYPDGDAVSAAKLALEL